MILISPPDVTIEHLLPPYSPGKLQELARWQEYQVNLRRPERRGRSLPILTTEKS
jgi:hypothetical protein